MLVSSVSNFCPDTRGRWWSLFKAHLFSRAVGREEDCKQYHWRVWGVLAVFQPHWVCPRSRCVCFHGLHFSGSRLLCWELSESGPGLYALPRSKSLRFRFSGTPQRHKLGWACFLCPSQVGAQSPPVEVCDLSPPLSKPLGFLGVQRARLLRCAVYLFWGADLWLRPFRWMSTVHNPKKSWLATKSACSLV